MDFIERQIAAAGFDAAFLTAALSGVPLYRRLGWHSQGPVVVTVPEDHRLVGLGMTKRLATNGNDRPRSAA